MKQGLETMVTRTMIGCTAIALAGCNSVPQAAIAATPPEDPPIVAPTPSPPPAMFLTAAPEDEPEQATDPEPTAFKEPSWTACKDNETSIFNAASVDDEFGFGIEVCVEPNVRESESRITVVWSGEGGNARTSCIASECDGVIDYNRYTRPRFTELTLKWDTENASHAVFISQDAEDPDAGPSTSTSYTFLSDEMREREIEAEPERLAPASLPLSLMRIESHLGTASN